MRSSLTRLLFIVSLLFHANKIFAAPSDHFVTRWETTAGDTVITIPTFPGATYNYAIDWDNDLTPDQTGITGDATHDFGGAGIHTIRIVGTFPRLYINNGVEKDKILSVEQWGTGSWTSMNKAFWGATNLVNNSTLAPDLTSATSLFKMFANASNIGTGSGTWVWNTSNVSGMAQMFLNATSFDKDISSWDISNVTNFTGMFSGATLSTTNYDALLISWDGQILSPSESFSGGNSVYCSPAAQTARASIITNDLWTITDGDLCNQAPTIISNATVSLDENITSVIMVEASDPESGSIIFTISGGADMDKFAFNPSNGQLLFGSPPDFENPNSSLISNTYVVDVTATDNGTPNLGDTQTITVTINDVNEAPSISSTSSVSVPENQTTALTVVANDPESNTITYGLSGGVDLDKFSIDANSGDVIFISVPDFENPASNATSNTYFVTVTATDVGNSNTSDTQDLTITVTNVNEAPTFTSPTTLSIPENQTFVTTLTSTDPESDSVTYLIVGAAGVDNLRFSVDSNTGDLSFLTPPDFESPTSFSATNAYVVSIRVQDTAFPQQDTITTFTVNVTDVAENTAPTITSANSINVAENQTTVITVASSDPESDVVTYSKSGVDSALFSLNASTGDLAFITAPDFETPSSSLGTNTYMVDITATDNGSPVENSMQALTITVTDVLEFSVFDLFTTTWKTNNISAGSSNSTSITIPTLGSGYSYQVDWNGDGDFDDIDEATIQTGDATHDYSTIQINQTINITGLFPRIYFNNSGDKDKILSIEQWGTNKWTSMQSSFYGASNLVNNAPDTPNLTITTSLSLMFYECSSIGALTESGNWNWDTSNIDSLEAMFVNASSFDKDISFWNVENVTTFLNMFAGVTLSSANYDALLISWDAQTLTPNMNFTGGNSQYCSQAAQTARANIISNFNWVITDGDLCNQAPTITSAATVDTGENQTTVITITSSDPELDTVTYALSGIDATLFNLDATTGMLNFITAPDFETPASSLGTNNYVVDITATDNGTPNLNDLQTLTINVTNVNESPTITSTNSINIAENQSTVLTIQADDPESDVITYTKAGADTALFSLDANTGDLAFITAPDFENPTSNAGANLYSIEITATDNGTPSLNDLQNLTIIITNENEAPTITSVNSLIIPENQTSLIQVTATDPESDLVTFGISGADAGLFVINSFSGILSFLNPPDFESPVSSLSTNTYVFDITATAQSNPTQIDVQTFSVTITNVNESPTITSPNNISIPENQTSVMPIIATDPEFDTLSYAISGGLDASLFDLNSNSGILTFKVAPDFENPNSALTSNDYAIQITVTDNGSPPESSTQSITISVTDVVDFTASEVFVTTWKTDNPGTSNNTSITIPTTTGFYAYNVDWNGDGDFDDVDEDIIYSGDATHDYIVAGTYTVKIGGVFPAISFSNSGDKEKILSIEQWGAIQWTVFVSAFHGAINLVNNATDTPDLSQVTSLSNAFRGASSIGSSTETGNWNWDISNITNLFSTFSGATNFDQDLSSWDISQVTSFSSMFISGNMSYQNYDALLISWSAQTSAVNKIFQAGNANYCSLAAQNAHDHLTNDLNWFIADGGLDASLCSNQTIQITSLPFVSVLENQTSVTALAVSNPNNVNLSFSISGGNDMNLFSISSSGVVTFNTPPDFEMPTSASGTNDYLIEVTVSNSASPTQSDTQNITVSVQDVVEFNPNELFITTWKTDNQGATNNSSINILVNNTQTYNYKVDWNGDGDFNDFEEDIFYTGNAIHDFGTSGTYTIKIFGEFPSIKFFNSGDKNKLISIDQWGTTQWKSLNNAFHSAINVVNNATDTPDLSLITDLTNMFFNASSIGNGNGNTNWNWNTSTVTNMTQLFFGATSFDENLDSWNVEQVNDMNSIFKDVPLSIVNYDAMLIAWNAQNLKPDVNFNANISQYCSPEAAIARQNMIDSDGWNINDAGRCPNRPPEFTSSNSVSIAENQISVITVTTTDIELDTVSYTIENNNDGNLFNIDAATGVLSFITAPDFETPNSSLGTNTYVVEVRAADNGTPIASNTQSITVTVTDLADNVAPVIISNASVSIAENTTDVITVQSSDAESNPIIYSISAGADQLLFNIGATTGNLSFISAPDFETPNSANNSNIYLVEVTATDNGNPIGSDSQLMSITVTDVVETLPVDLSLQFTNSPSSVETGGLVDYSFVINNIGTEDVTSANVLDTLPSELIASTWTCTSTGLATCSASGTGEINDTIDIPVGTDSVTYNVSATVTTGVFNEFTYQAQVNANTPQFDFDLTNNTQSVTTINGDIVFSDGFEAPIIVLKSGSKNISIDLREFNNIGINPTAIIKGLDNNNDINFWVHLRKTNHQLQIRYSNKIDGIWQAGQWLDVKNKIYF